MRRALLAVLLLFASHARAADESAALAKASIAALGAGLAQRDLTAFLAAGAADVRANSNEQALAAFADLNGLDWAALARVDPVLLEDAEQGERLVLRGFFPTQPLRVYFALTYAREDDAWKLSGIDVRPVPLVTARTTRDDAGWVITLELVEPAREILYALPGAAFRATGVATTRDAPSTDIRVAELPRKLEVKLVTADGTIGPVTLEFDATKELVANAVRVLESTTESWAYLRTYGNSELLYFEQLVRHRCGIASVRYSVDSDALDREYALPPCDSTQVDDFQIVRLDRRPRFVAVQLDYRNGKRSPIVRLQH